jgi:hypothetical protein
MLTITMLRLLIHEPFKRYSGVSELALKPFKIYKPPMILPPSWLLPLLI